MPHLSYAQHFQGVADLFLRDPERYGSMLQFIENVMTRASELSKSERELLAAHVSHLNGCGFCVGAHRATLTTMNVASEEIDGATEDTPSSTDAKFRALLDFAGKLTRTPAAITAGDIADLRHAGWSEQAIEDAVNVVALFGYVNRLVDAVGIEGNDAYFAHVGRAIATQGYAPLIKTALQAAG